MNGEETRSNEVAQTEEAARGSAPRAEEHSVAGIVDLGAASKRTRGSITGFIVEQGAFPLRDF